MVDDIFMTLHVDSFGSSDISVNYLCPFVRYYLINSSSILYRSLK